MVIFQTNFPKTCLDYSNKLCRFAIVFKIIFEQRYKIVEKINRKSYRIMTAQEFTSRTGIELTNEQMNAIHEVYMTTNDDKDYFCAIIKSQYEADRCNLEYMLDLGRHLADERKKREESKKALEDKFKALQEWIYSQTLSYDIEILGNLKQKCKQMFGEKEFYARFITDDGGLDSEDMAAIVSILRK